MRLTPRQRATVRIRLAQAIGEGRPVDRHVVIAEMFGTDAPVSSPDATLTAEPVTPVPVLAVAFLAPDIVTPDAVPDEVVSWVDAAEMVGVSVATCKRYAAPSSGKLTRVDDGVSLMSVRALSAPRAA